MVYLIYLDCTNLYGTSMTEKLPTGEFRWLRNRERVMRFDSQDGLYHMRGDIDLNNKIGCLLEVDITLPENIHDKTNDMPLAAGDLIVEERMLSPFQKKFPQYAKEANKKLAPNTF